MEKTASRTRSVTGLVPFESGATSLRPLAVPAMIRIGETLTLSYGTATPRRRPSIALTSSASSG